MKPKKTKKAPPKQTPIRQFASHGNSGFIEPLLGIFLKPLPKTSRSVLSILAGGDLKLRFEEALRPNAGMSQAN